MGFFSELKSDLSQAVNTLMPEDKPEAEGLDNKATETKEPVDIDSMLNRLDDIKLEDSAAKTEEKVEELEEKLDETAKEEEATVVPEVPAFEETREEEEEPASEEDVLEEKIEEQTMEELEVEAHN